MLILQGQARPLENLAFSPDSVFVAASDRDGPIELWDTVSARLAHTFPSHTHHDAYSFQFHSLTGQLYAPGNKDGIVVHDPKTGETVVNKVRGATVARVAVAPDGSSLLYYHYAEKGRRTFCRRGIRPNGKAVASWAVPLFPPDAEFGWTRALQYIGDGTRFCTTDYTGGNTNRVAIRSVATGDILATTKIPHPDPWGLAVTPDASYFAVRGGTKLMVWGADELEKKPRLFNAKPRRAFTGMAFHPSGRFLAATAGDAVTFFDVATGEIAFTFAWKVGMLGAVCFAPDGTKAAVGSSDGRVVVWDVDA